MELHVSQRPVGGHGFTVFDAEIELIPGKVEVEVVIEGVYPSDASEEEIREAGEAIRHGVEKALQPYASGAYVYVWRLGIHPIDFNTNHTEYYTNLEMSRMLAKIPGSGV